MGAGAPPPRHQMLPAGWVAEVVTYLEMCETPPSRPDPVAGGMALLRIRPDAAGFRDRFRRVGEPWLWASRLRLDDGTLTAILAADAVEIYDLMIGPDTIGLLELDFRQ